jgi:cytidine deaminase
MKKALTQSTQLTSYSSREELPVDWKNLLDQAESVLSHSYSKYSGFSVAAAVLLDNNETVLGTNQENIAYPSGMCAERNALFSVSTNFPNTTIKAIAITAKSIHGKVASPVTPCGGCRQVMIEFETKQNSPITVIMGAQEGEVWVADDIKTLIPFYFSSNEVGTAEK